MNVKAILKNIALSNEKNKFLFSSESAREQQKQQQTTTTTRFVVCSVVWERERTKRIENNEKLRAEFVVV